MKWKTNGEEAERWVGLLKSMRIGSHGADAPAPTTQISTTSPGAPVSKLYTSTDPRFARGVHARRDKGFYKHSDAVLRPILEAERGRQGAVPKLVMSESRKQHDKQMHIANGNTSWASQSVPKLVMPQKRKQHNKQTQIANGNTTSVPNAVEALQVVEVAPTGSQAHAAVPSVGSGRIPLRNVQNAAVSGERLGPSDPSCVPVAPDGLCLYYCALAGRDLCERMTTHDLFGWARSAQRLQDDKSQAEEIRRGGIRRAKQAAARRRSRSACRRRQSRGTPRWTTSCGWPPTLAEDPSCAL